MTSTSVLLLVLAPCLLICAFVAAGAAGRRRHARRRKIEAERGLLELRGTLTAVLEATTGAVLVVDSSSRLRYANRAAARLLDRGSVDGLLELDLREAMAVLAERLHPEDRVQLLDRLADPEISSFELELRVEGTHEEEEEEVLSIRSTLIESPVHVRALAIRDLTEERRLETQLRHSQKMETIGTLAGGLAHDFNNQLTAILGNARLARMAAPRNATVQERLVDLERAADQCARLTKSLLSFSRRAPVSIGDRPVRRLLGDTRTLLESSLRSNIRLAFEIDDDLETVKCDPQQLQQTLFELACNAQRAMLEGGRLTIRARRSTGDDGGDFVELEIEDDGHGIDPRHCERIFDPFFTTQPVDQSAGLGLSVVHGMVHAQGGTIDVRSEPDEGTVFTIRLHAGGPLPEAQPMAVEPTATATVLVADDEAPVRRLIRQVLEPKGFTVLEASDGAEALEVYRGHEGEIALVIVDLTMPNLDGRQVIEAIHAAAPGFPIILSSGHFGQERLELDGVDILPKPYTPNELVERVRSGVLGRVH